MDRLELFFIEIILIDIFIYNGDIIVFFFRIVIIVIYLRFYDNLINLLGLKIYLKFIFR